MPTIAVDKAALFKELGREYTTKEVRRLNSPGTRDFGNQDIGSASATLKTIYLPSCATNDRA